MAEQAQAAAAAAAGHAAALAAKRAAEDAGAGVFVYGMRLVGASWRQQADGGGGRVGHLAELGTPDGLPPPDDVALPVLWLGALPREELPTALGGEEPVGTEALLVAHEASAAGGFVAPVPLYASAERAGAPLLELRLPARRAHDPDKWLHFGLAAYVSSP